MKTTEQIIYEEIKDGVSFDPKGKKQIVMAMCKNAEEFAKWIGYNGWRYKKKTSKWEKLTNSYGKLYQWATTEKLYKIFERDAKQ